MSGDSTVESGVRLAACPRSDGTQLRADLNEYQGHLFISLRVWEQGRDRRWYPTKRGCSVRLSEARQVAEALLEGHRLATDRQAQEAQIPTPSPNRRPRGERPDPRRMSLPQEQPGRAEDFDEFEN